MMSVEKSEKSDVIKRLFRSASDVVRKLDKMAKNASSVQDFYKTDVLAQRIRLREICERLMFLDPAGQGKKAEDILWRKVFYETISAAKNLRKSASWNNSDQYWVSNHIKLGIGTYHHLLFRLQSEFPIRESGTDFLPLQDLRGSVKEKYSKRASAKLEMEDNVVMWAFQAYQRCLICMGDLNRYHQELCGEGKSRTAFRYYHQALLVGAPSSMPHNQLGTLAGSRNYCCDAAYFYMRCIMSVNGFEGAKGNLQTIFEKNQQLLHACLLEASEGFKEQKTRELQVKSFVIGFLRYCEECFRYPDEDLDFPIGHLCQIVIENFQKCLDATQFGERRLPVFEPKTPPVASGKDVEVTTSVPNEEPPSHLSDNLIFKIFTMLMMCIEKLDREASPHSSAATALTLAAFSHLLGFILLRFKKLFGFSGETASFSDVGLPSQEKLPSIPEEIGDQTSPRDQCYVNSNEKDQSNKLVPFTCSKRRERKGRLTKKNMRYRRKPNDGLSLDDSDLSEGRESSSSSSDTDENDSGSNASENDESIASSHCTDDDERVDSNCVEEPPESREGDANDDDLKLKGIVNGNNNEKESGVIEKIPTDGPPASDIKQATEERDAKNCFSQTQIDDLDSVIVEKHLLNGELLSIIKVCGDWLRSNPHIITASAQGSHKLWARYTDLLNLLVALKRKLSTENVDVKVIKKSESWSKPGWKQTWPLPEDIVLEGFPLLASAHQTIDFELRSSLWMTCIEEILLRLSCLHHLGFVLTTYSELGITYDGDRGLFAYGACPPNVTNGTDDGCVVKKKRRSWSKQDLKAQDHKKHLMHNMAQLWLEAEVKELETSLQSMGRPRFSPYLVPDSSVLIDSLHIVRQLMSSKMFIFILPIAVLQSLDRLKKESIKAREAIRWLEAEFRKRNRYFRAQKHHERMSLSLLKYPKRKEKQAWNNFAILECAHFFARQGSHSNELSANLVTVLTGHVKGGGSSNNNSGSAAAESDKSPNNNNLFLLASSTGLKVENVEDLYASWVAANKPASETK